MLNIFSWILRDYRYCSINDFIAEAKKIPNYRVKELSNIQNNNYCEHNNIKTYSPNDSNNNSIVNVVNKMFPLRYTNSDNSNKIISNYNGTNIAMFEVEMEGVTTDNSHRNMNLNSIKPSGNIYRIERDGYKDRNTNIW